MSKHTQPKLCDILGPGACLQKWQVSGVMVSRDCYHAKCFAFIKVAVTVLVTDKISLGTSL